MRFNWISSIQENILVINNEKLGHLPRHSMTRYKKRVRAKVKLGLRLTQKISPINK